jgi:hypothetical protein
MTSITRFRPELPSPGSGKACLLLTSTLTEFLMSKASYKLRVSFQAKVLAPVVAVLVVLTGATMWVVNHRISGQLHYQAEQQLDTADKVFQNAQTMRADALLLRYRNVSNEPRLKALVTQTDSKTTSEALKGMFDEDPADVFIVLSADGKPFASSNRDPRLNLDRFEAASVPSIQKALDGEPKMDTIQIEGGFFNLVSVPIRVGNDIAGVLGVGVETREADAQQIKKLTHSEVLFIVNHRVAASSLSMPGAYPGLIGRFAELQASGSAGLQPVEEVLNHEHFLCKAGSFPSPGGGSGYLLLSSYEIPL